MMSTRETEALLRNVDQRLQRVEQVLPTLATKQDLNPLTTKEELRAEVAALSTREELRAEVAKLSTKGEVREASEQTRRHMSVLFESLRDDVRIVAEGQVALATRVEDIYTELLENDAKLDRRVTRLEAQAGPMPAPRKPGRR